MPAPVSAIPNSDYGMIAARLIADAALSRFGPSEIGAKSGTDQASLVAALRASDNPVEQGNLLRALDEMTGGSSASNTAFNNSELTSQVAAAAGTRSRRTQFDASSLYSRGGPSANDIRQNNFGDCYYVGVLGAIANQNPAAIRNAIEYIPRSQSFNVTLYNSSGRAQTINVTQAEIASNIAMGGGSGRDNGIANAPIWPDVMEVAFAKQRDTNHANGLTQGYDAIRNGGNATESYRTITGRSANFITYDQGFFESRSNAMNEVGNQVSNALNNGKPVTLDTKTEVDGRSVLGRVLGRDIPQDGLADSHTYTVTGAYKNSAGEWQVTLRNPWGHNNSSRHDEGHNTTSAYITVPLSRLVDTGGLSGFDIGR